MKLILKGLLLFAFLSSSMMSDPSSLVKEDTFHGVKPGNGFYNQHIESASNFNKDPRFETQLKNEKENSSTLIEIQLDQKFQAIEGFGSSLVTYKDFPEEYYDPGFFDLVVNDLGMSIVRIPLMEHLEYKNDDDDPDHFNWSGFFVSDNLKRKGLASTMLLLQEFKKRGVDRFMATPWSPPEFLKTHRSPVQAGYLRADMLDEFAEYIAAQIKLAKNNYGIDLKWVSVQNELLFSEFYRSCIYQPWMLKETVKALEKKFKAEGINSQLLLPEDMMFPERMLYYIHPLIQDPETRNFNGHFSTHRKAGKEGLLQWVDKTKEYERQNWMTETSGHNPDWQGALSLAEDIHEYLVYGNFSAWIYWQLSETRSSSKYSLLADGDPTPKYYASKHFYKFIRPGARRVYVHSDDEELLVSAFHHESNGTLTLVLINKSDSLKTIHVNGNYTFRNYLSSEEKEFEDQGSYKSGQSISITSRSIITLHARKRKLRTRKTLSPLLPAVNEVSGPFKVNKDPFPRKRPFQLKEDGGNISAHEQVRQIIREGKMNTEMHNGWTPLHTSIMNGDGDALKLLLEAGADVNATAHDGWTVLHMAAGTFADNLDKENRLKDYTRYDILRMVLDQNPDLSLLTEDGLTPLHSAVMNAYTGWRGVPEHSLRRIKDLIHFGINLEAKDQNGLTALHWAAYQGYLYFTGLPEVNDDIVDLLLENGAEINARDAEKNTPLHLAVIMGYESIILRLLEAGADTSLLNGDGLTVREIAEKYQNQRILFILKYKKLPDSERSMNPRPETKVSKYGPELLKAAWDGDIELVKELLSNGADTDYIDSDGFKAIDRARDNGFEEIATAIFEHENK